ncbi:MAG: hypothetical protein V3T83_08500 [Acidobacteriota bacterium]
MEKEFLRNLSSYSEPVQKRVRQSLLSQIVYADPMDLTKMLNIPPGSEPLPGVAEAMKLFYPD